MYYDMSGFDYGILDVVQVLHLRKRRGNYYDCPFCGETHGKLNINVEKNVFRCNRCDASGGMLICTMLHSPKQISRSGKH